MMAEDSSDLLTFWVSDSATNQEVLGLLVEENKRKSFLIIE